MHGLAGTYTVYPGEFQPANDVAFEQEAEGCQHSFLGLVALGHASVGYIAKENRIGRIAIVDHAALVLWSGIYTRYCTIITGEKLPENANE
ncbi:MAG: TRL-like family protein [Leptospiraceae bacterium]|nr:TRL-like family protein [Leptospiraceae bacterium]